MQRLSSSLISWFAVFYYGRRGQTAAFVLEIGGDVYVHTRLWISWTPYASSRNEQRDREEKAFRESQRAAPRELERHCEEGEQSPHPRDEGGVFVSSSILSCIVCGYLRG